METLNKRDIKTITHYIIGLYPNVSKVVIEDCLQDSILVYLLNPTSYNKEKSSFGSFIINNTSNRILNYLNSWNTRNMLSTGDVWSF